MTDLNGLAQKLVPHKTVLFLGSGAAVSSGGPTGIELARHLSKSLAGTEAVSDDLMETASLLEHRTGREAIVRAIRARLDKLQPTGSLVALAQFGWSCIFSTNYDTLIEQAYRAAGVQLVTVRSNHEYSKVEDTEATQLFKIHGCVTQDIVDGHLSRMVITERDYEEHEEYRQVLFRRLQLELVAHDIVILGHSLKDPHIKRDIASAARLKRDAGAKGNIFFVLYEADEDRARLYEQKGVRVVSGSLESFVHELAERKEQITPSTVTATADQPLLTARQLACSVDVESARMAASDAKKMFHGSEATYSDIRMGLTFRRSIEDELVAALTGDRRFAVVTGVAGIGKTTLARRVLSHLRDKGFRCWEWRKEFPFKSVDWLKTDALLREKQIQGALLIDECADSLRQINVLATALARRTGSALRIVLTANHSQWVPRVKSPELFKQAILKLLSQLDEPEIDELINLLDLQTEIRALADPLFTTLPRKQKIERLRRKCSADMFVCLKYVFSFESLDTILLREFSELAEPLQDIYRRVAFLETAAGLVHRQLIIRLVELSPTVLSAFMCQLEGLVDEFDIKPELGLYGLRTRHGVVARTLARYKFADNDDVVELLRAVIDHANPSIWVELKMLRELCAGEGGISRVANPHARIELLRRVIEIIPGEPLPRHRIIKTLLDIDAFDEAEMEIRDALERSRFDPPLHRYRIRLLLYKGLRSRGLEREDRAALLREAERLAQDAIARFRADKQAYKLYAEVGEAIARELGDKSALDHAIYEMQEAMNRLLDPDFAELTRSFAKRRGF